MNILHLSDLHLSNKDSSNSNIVVNELIKDVKHNTMKKSSNIDLIIISGDIAEKGKFEENYDYIHEQLTKLSYELDVPLNRFVFTSGNHDIKRSYPLRATSSDLREKTIQKDEFEDFWDNIVRVNQKEFHKMVLNYNPTVKHTRFDDAIYIQDINKKRVCFLSLNTCWSFTGKDDYGNIMYNEHQFEELKHCIEPLEYDILLLIMHVPIDWITESDREKILEYFYNNQTKKSDILFTGHVHKTDMYLIKTPNCSFYNLTTGIGYPNKYDDSKNRLRDCKYNLYNIDLLCNNVEVSLRTSNHLGKFAADTQKYDEAKDDGILLIENVFSIGNYDVVRETEKSKKNDENIMRGNNHDYKMLTDLIPEIDDWTGRESLIDSILEGEHKVVTISGVGGQGKTTLAAELCKRYSRNGHEVMWIDFKEMNFTVHEKLLRAISYMTKGTEKTAKYQEEPINQTIRRFITHMSTGKWIVVFDNVDAYVDHQDNIFVSQVKKIYDEFIKLNSKSKIIFTCRPIVTESNSRYRLIQLEGFNHDEVIELFKKRGFEYTGGMWEDFKELTKITQGHPWWLGLIIGQVVSLKKTIKGEINAIKLNNSSYEKRIGNYFTDIWEKINNEQQKVLRYLVEVTRPVTTEELINVIDLKRKKIIKSIEVVRNLGLVEMTTNDDDDYMYSVHPLVIEFIHSRFSVQHQTHIVKSWLTYFMNSKIVTMLFGTSVIEVIEILPQDIVLSIETCINSRNYLEALKLCSSCRYLLCDQGYVKEYLKLSNQVLNSIDWDENDVVTSYNSSILLSDVIDKNYLSGDEKSAQKQLEKYSLSVKENSLPYTAYLDTLASFQWRKGNYEGSLTTIMKLEKMSEELGSEWDMNNYRITKGIVLRELGRIDEALDIFESSESSTSKSGSYYGNLAKCYLLSNQYNETRANLIKSYQKLSEDDGYTSSLNKGYAYLWASEYLLKKGHYKEAFYYIHYCKVYWKEMAPGMLYLTECLESQILGKYDNSMLGYDFVKDIQNKFEAFL